MRQRPLQFGASLIVHLERATSRLSQVEYLTSTLPKPVEVVQAVDGKSGIDELHRYTRKLHSPTYPFTMNHPEIATFLSHRACWQKIVDEEMDYALIVEDDIEIDETIFEELIRNANSSIEPGDFIRFPIKLKERKKNIRFSNDHLSIFEPVVVGLGMVCQLVTKEAAKKLLEETKAFDRPIDTFIQMKWIHHVNVLTSEPNCISEISNLIGGSTIQGNLNISEQINREILRPVYRLRVDYLSKKYNQAP